MKKSFILTLLFCLFTAGWMNAQKKVYTIGDSTMEQYDFSTSDKCGWPQMLPQFLTDDVTIYNHGKSGASSKSFYKEAPYWQTVLKQLNEGDFPIVQFAHNDEKNDGADSDVVKEYYN